MTTIETKLAEIERKYSDYDQDKYAYAPVADHVPALCEALRIVVARHIVEQNQTDGFVSGVHLTGLDWKNICETIIGEQP